MRKTNQHKEHTTIEQKRNKKGVDAKKAKSCGFSDKKSVTKVLFHYLPQRILICKLVKVEDIGNTVRSFRKTPVK